MDANEYRRKGIIFLDAIIIKSKVAVIFVVFAIYVVINKQKSKYYILYLKGRKW
jgi:hypothetical protein